MERIRTLTRVPINQIRISSRGLFNNSIKSKNIEIGQQKRLFSEKKEDVTLDSILSSITQISPQMTASASANKSTKAGNNKLDDDFFSLEDYNDSVDENRTLEETPLEDEGYDFLSTSEEEEALEAETDGTPSKKSDKRKDDKDHIDGIEADSLASSYLDRTKSRKRFIKEHGIDPVAFHRLEIGESPISLPGHTLEYAGESLIKENLEELASTFNKGKTQLNELKHFKIYPEQIKKWVSDAKTPLGFYNYHGEWTSTGVNIPPLTENQIKEIESQPKEVPKAKSKKGNVKTVVRIIPSKNMEKENKDLEGQYRFGVKPDEIEKMPEKIKELFSMKNAKKGEINLFRINRAKETFKNCEYDTGSSAVQVAIMSEKIRYLTDHLTKHRKDQTTVNALKQLIDKRRKMMKYLKYRDGYKYMQICKTYGIKDIPVMHKIKPARALQLEG